MQNRVVVHSLDVLYSFLQVLLAAALSVKQEDVGAAALSESYACSKRCLSMAYDTWTLYSTSTLRNLLDSQRKVQHWSRGDGSCLSPSDLPNPAKPLRVSLLTSQLNGGLVLLLSVDQPEGAWCDTTLRD